MSGVLGCLPQYSGAVTPVITFNPSAWLAQFPEFVDTVPPALAEAYSQVASAYIDIGGTSPMANNLPVMTQAWYFTIAHIAQLFTGTAANPASPLVGRISNASEGSVSVAVDMPQTTSQLAGWFAQTKYGAAAWAMMAQFRQAFYVPGLVPNFQPVGWPPLGIPVQLPFLNQ